MKRLILLMITIVFTLTAQSKVWRVNNIAGINADFNNFTAAQANASASDTLYIEGSTTSYGNITLTKPLVIIGPGYFLTENPQTQANSVCSTFGTITFSTGSTGSIITGLKVTDIIEIKVGDISVIRNYVIAGIKINSNESFGNILISNNYIEGNVNCTGDSQIYNIIITNNYIDSANSISFGENYSGIISNNVIYTIYDLDIHNFSIINNILRGGPSIPLDNVFFNNIGSSTQFPNNNNNQQNVNMTDVFVGKTGNSTDGQWQLKPYSPALGAGSDGTDCGIFGGSSPYVLSGLPSIPAIYEITMPTTGDNLNGIDVTIKAKTH